MAYNSNGYIMLDFSMLDFSRTNQVIEGIYQRVFEIVGVNKFVLILNAQSKTPLPACVSFVNSSYVIESFLYNFAITIDDNVRIENVSSDIIKDGVISAGTTWSSSKINDELHNLPAPEALKYKDVTTNFNSYGLSDVSSLFDDGEVPVVAYNKDVGIKYLYWVESYISEDIIKYEVKGVNPVNLSNIPSGSHNLRIYYCTIN